MRRTRGFALGLALLGAALLACGEGDRFAGQDPLVARRYVALDGAANFRDLGGYETADGRHVRWGLFYRSDNLSKLSDADLEKLDALGIRLVCDFRGPDEVAAAPDRLPTPPPEVAHLAIYDESFSGKQLQDAITSGELDQLDLRQLLIDANRLFATRFAPEYRAMFERITQRQNLPALVHCTAGKDRAGFASALILRTLGVPTETIYQDFLLTNFYTARKIERTLWIIRLMSLFRADPEKVRPVLGVERAYLDSAFSAIDEQYGDFDTYRRKALGLDDEAVEAFRKLGLD